MSPAILINLLFPLVTGGVLWFMKPAEGSLVSFDCLLWFAIGATLQIIAALVLMGRNARRWVIGWTLLWLSSAAYMAGYAPAHIQDKEIGGKWSALTAPEPQFPKGMEVTDQEREELVVRKSLWQREVGAADRWFREQYELSSSEKKYETLALRDLASSSYLLYVLAFAFLSAFFSISWFAGRGRLHEYKVPGGNEEDPLAKNHMGREPNQA